MLYTVLFGLCQSWIPAQPKPELVLNLLFLDWLDAQQEEYAESKLYSHLSLPSPHPAKVEFFSQCLNTWTCHGFRLENGTPGCSNVHTKGQKTSNRLNSHCSLSHCLVFPPPSVHPFVFVCFFFLQKIPILGRSHPLQILLAPSILAPLCQHGQSARAFLLGNGRFEFPMFDEAFNRDSDCPTSTQRSSPFDGGKMTPIHSLPFACPKNPTESLLHQEVLRYSRSLG